MIDDDADVGSAITCAEWAAWFGHVPLRGSELSLSEFLDTCPTNFNKTMVRGRHEHQTWPAIPKPFFLKALRLGAKVARTDFPIDAPPANYINSWRGRAKARGRREAAPARRGQPRRGDGPNPALDLPRWYHADTANSDQSGTEERPTKTEVRRSEVAERRRFRKPFAGHGCAWRSVS